MMAPLEKKKGGQTKVDRRKVDKPKRSIQSLLRLFQIAISAFETIDDLY